MLQKFKKVIKKEALIYLFTLLALALTMHFDLVTNPSTRLESMQKMGNYTHPFLYSFAIYFIILVFRKAIKLVMGLFEKKKG